jgi:hypothetical protein
MKTIKKVIKWAVLTAALVFGIVAYMLISHPYLVMNLFGPSQEQVNKEWNHPCYNADCQ